MREGVCHLSETDRCGVGGCFLPKEKRLPLDKLERTVCSGYQLWGFFGVFYFFFKQRDEDQRKLCKGEPSYSSDVSFLFLSSTLLFEIQVKRQGIWPVDCQRGPGSGPMCNWGQIIQASLVPSLPCSLGRSRMGSQVP